MKRLNGMRIIAAVSGGADSVALLLKLIEKRAAGEIALIAVHMEHGIRGEASVGDMEFVAALCAKKNVPLFVYRADVPRYASENGLGIETAARVLRYRAFDDLLESTGFDRVALAHHADDQAETVLMHIMRGSSLSGARGMAFDTGKYVRPLLGFPKSELIAYLAENGIGFRQDETNFVADNPRNALRQAFEPLKAFYPGATRAICRFAEMCAEDDGYIGEAADLEFERRVKHFDGGVIMDMRGLHPALFGRIAARVIDEPDANTIRMLRSLDGYAELRGGYKAYAVNGTLYIYRELAGYEPVPVKVPGTTVLPGGGCIDVTAAEGGIIRDNGNSQTVNGEALSGAVARRRLNGDRIQPFGMTGTKSLSDYLTDRKIPKPLRNTLTVIASGNEILWVPGVGLSEKMRADIGGDNIMIEFRRDRYV